MRRSVARAVIGSGGHPGQRHAAFGGCGPWLAPTRSESSACLWWVRTVGPHYPSDTCAPALCRPTVGIHLKRITQASTGAPFVGANLGWHKQPEALTPPWGPGAGRIVPTKVGTYQERGITLPRHCADQRSAPTNSRSPQSQVSSALPPLPTCSASTWPRSSGPHHPAPG